MIKENKYYKFLEQVKQEAYKVTWPDKKELITSTIIVIITVFIFSILCLLLDYGIHGIVQFILNIGK